MTGRNQMREYEGTFNNNESMKIAIVVSRFNNHITDSLLSGAIEGLIRYGVNKDDIHIAKVPGALEIPMTIQKLTSTLKPDACIAIGCVVKGATDHYHHVSNLSSAGVADLALKLDIPVLNCILTTENIEQAIERTGVKLGNKGFEAAVAAVEMVSLFRKLS